MFHAGLSAAMAVALALLTLSSRQLPPPTVAEVAPGAGDNAGLAAPPAREGTDDPRLPPSSVNVNRPVTANGADPQPAGGGAATGDRDRKSVV